jgi:hypothetical protein
MPVQAGRQGRSHVTEPAHNASHRWRQAGLRILAHPPVIAGLVTAVGILVWVVAFPRVGTDLSAALARAGWASDHPASGYLFSWYGGFHPAGYSLLAPYVLGFVGTRLSMAIAVVISAVLLTGVLVRHNVTRPRAAAVWVAIALWTELSAGRAAFTLGLAAALGCVAVVDVCLSPPPRAFQTQSHQSGPPKSPTSRIEAIARLAAIGALALLCCLLSPVAAVFLLVFAGALAVGRHIVHAIVIAVATILPLGAMALFSDGGAQPLLIQNWVPTLGVLAAVLLLVPRRWRLVRAGAIIYGLGVLVTLAVPSLIGSNVARLGELLAGPILIGMGSSRRRWLLALALAGVAVWQVAQPIADLQQGNAPPYAPQTAALVRELRVLHAGTARVEAVPQYGHWESQELASAVPLARGWERQLDINRNPLFYGGVLTPAAYFDWLRSNAVWYVAISTATPDPAAVAEAATVRAGQPWLVLIWHDAYWRLYRVLGSIPLASAPGTVVGSTPAQITLRMSRPGATIIRVHWSPLLSAQGAVVSRAGLWTRITARRAGTFELQGRY